MKKTLINSIRLGLASTAIIGTLGLGSVKGLDTLEAILWQHPDNYSGRSDYVTQFNTEQLFVSSNPRLNQEFETKGHAYVFVHTGYFGSYGYFKHGSAEEYEEYMKNVTQLISKINDSGSLVLYLIEDIAGKRSEEILGLIDNPFVIVTDWRNPYPERYVKTESGKKEQKPDLVYSFLRDNGVKEVRFIGEMVWWGNRLACLGTAAESFYKHGFDVRGVEGGIFPTTSSNGLLLNLDPRGRIEGLYDALGLHKGIANSEVLERIYTDAVVLK